MGQVITMAQYRADALAGEDVGELETQRDVAIAAERERLRRSEMYLGMIQGAINRARFKLAHGRWPETGEV